MRREAKSVVLFANKLLHVGDYDEHTHAAAAMACHGLDVADNSGTGYHYTSTNHLVRAVELRSFVGEVFGHDIVTSSGDMVESLPVHTQFMDYVELSSAAITQLVVTQAIGNFCEITTRGVDGTRTNSMTYSVEWL